nr:Nucleic acid binding domain containing protein [Haemonchus contortus]
MIKQFCFLWRRYSVNAFTTRTHNCGELTRKDEGVRVCIKGWLAYKRMDRFIVLRDSYGTVQACIGPGSELCKMVKDLPYESVVQVEGTVVSRGENMNPKMKTGEIENHSVCLISLEAQFTTKMVSGVPPHDGYEALAYTISGTSTVITNVRKGVID